MMNYEDFAAQVRAATDAIGIACDVEHDDEGVLVANEAGFQYTIQVDECELIGAATCNILKDGDTLHEASDEAEAFGLLLTELIRSA